MDPIEPWVDREELRRMAAALLAPPLPVSPPPPPDATYGEEFVGYLGEEGLSPGKTPPAAEPLPPAPPPVAPSPGELVAPTSLQHPMVERNARSALAAAREIAQRGGLLMRRPGDPDQSATDSPDEDSEPSAPPPPVPAEPEPKPEPEPASAAPEPAGSALQPPAPASPPPQPAPASPTRDNSPQAAVPPALPPAAGPGSDSMDPSVPMVAAELTQVSPLPATPHAPGVSTPFVARLQAYGNWLREGIAAKAFFVMDREGGVLIDEVQSPKLQQVARTLAQASRTANRQAGAAAIGNLHVKIAPENVLEVVPVMTRYGPLILGIIVQLPLPARNVEAVARGLQQVIDGVSGPPAT